jgi:hypothetical protein
VFRLRALSWLLLTLLAAPAWSQATVTSAAADEVDVTLYRNPDRSPGRPFSLSWLEGFALISETRRITLPAGESVIRFEGVAGGMIPQSANVTGFPDDIVERNRDAYLLSPGTLLDRSLGRRVTLRRMSRATGETREQDAVIRSGAGGAVVLQTAQGFETLRCTGLPETLVYDQVPPGLSPRPTLSVRARSREPVTATVTLSYLATGFDWQANYIATLSPDGETADLFAWLTLGSQDETSFVEADTQAVAGRLNYRRVEPQPREGGPLTLQCWRHLTTSDIPLLDPPQRQELDRMADEEVTVTGSRIPGRNLESNAPVTVITAEQEELGDLKLYRIPEPVTVAANSQKQVALLQRAGVRVDIVHRQHFYAVNPDLQDMPPQRVLVTRNRSAEGLGLPLPGGGLVLFAAGGDRPVLLGEGEMADRAVGEDVEVELGPSVALVTEIRRLRERNGRRSWEMVVSNDSSRPVRFEADFNYFQGLRAERRLARRDGRPLWSVLVPANGSATLRFRDRKPN